MNTAAQRPADWKKVIDQESESCHWIAPDGKRHPGTDAENLEVRRQLLSMRARGEALDHKQHER